MVTSPFGIAGPKRLEAEIVERWYQVFRKAYSDEARQAIIRRWDMPQDYLGPAVYLDFARGRVVYEQQVVARLGLSID